MTNTPPDPKSSPTNALGFDEFIGILIAFVSIGAVIFWSFSRSHSNWNLDSLLVPSPTPSPTPTVFSKKTFPTIKPRPTPSAKKSSFVVTPLPNLAPSKLPKELASVPFPSTVKRFPLVVPAEKKPTIPPPITFNDVSNNFWATRFIDVLSSRNIIKGYRDNSFRPNQPVTRAEFAAILQQAFENQLIQTKNKLSFKDLPKSFWATSAIDQAIKTGFLKGYPDNTFKAQQKIPRVQVLVALVSGLNLKITASQTKILSIYKDAKQIPLYAKAKVAVATENAFVVNYPDPSIFDANKEATRAEVAAMVHQALVEIGRLDPIESPNIVKFPK